MKQNKKKLRAEAETKVIRLFELASAYPESADKYVEIARKKAMKVNLRFTSVQRRKICKHCYKYLVPGRNARVRIHDSKIIYHCDNCKKFTRIPIGKKSVSLTRIPRRVRKDL